MPRLVFRSHAIRRMFERSITVEDVRAIVAHGRTIEDRPDDLPHPSRLIVGKVGGLRLHVVVAENTSADELIVVTVYEPDPALWSRDFMRRRRR